MGEGGEDGRERRGKGGCELIIQKASANKIAILIFAF